MGYAILCNTPPDEKSSSPISSVFQDARNEGSIPAEFMLLDCKHTLPSGKTISERFSLDLEKTPTIFLSGKVGEPKQIPTKHLKTGNMLVKALNGLLGTKAIKI